MKINWELNNNIMNTCIIEQESFLSDADAETMGKIKQQGSVRRINPLSISSDYCIPYSNLFAGHQVRFEAHIKRIRRNLCMSYSRKLNR